MKTAIVVLSVLLLLVGSVLGYFIIDRTIARNQAQNCGANQLSPEMNGFMKEMNPGMIGASRSDGVFLKLMAEMVRPKKAVEIGTLRGYSALWIALGIRGAGGKLQTLEIDPEMVRTARANIKKAGLGDTITVVEGDALETIPRLKGPIEFVFIDARKSDYLKYFNLLYPKVARGGVIIAHNAVMHSRDMSDYLDTVRTHPELETVIVSTTLWDGMAVSYKLR